MLALLGLAKALRAEPEAAAALPLRPLLRAPILDGEIDAQEWSGAVWVEGFRDSRGAQRPEAELALARHGSALLLALRTAVDPEAGLLARAPRAERDTLAPLDDAIRVWLAAPGPEAPLYEIVANARGALWDAVHRPGAAGFESDLRYASGAELGGRSAGGFWEVELRIPLPDARDARAPEWRVAVERIEQRPFTRLGWPAVIPERNPLALLARISAAPSSEDAGRSAPVQLPVSSRAAERLRASAVDALREPADAHGSAAPGPEQLQAALSFYCSFDSASTRADLAGGVADPVAVGGALRFVPGRFGRALAIGRGAGGGSFEYASEANLDFARPGALSFWIAPLDWEDPAQVRARGYVPMLHRRAPAGNHFTLNRMGFDTRLARGDRLSAGFWAPGGSHNGLIQLESTLGWRAGEWHFVALSWRREAFELSIDAAAPVSTSFRTALTPASFRIGNAETPFEVGGSADELSAIDELQIFTRPLARSELLRLARAAQAEPRARSALDLGPAATAPPGLVD